MSSKTRQSLKPQRRYIVLLIILAVALYIVVPQLGDFHTTFQQLRHPKLSALLIAVGAAALTYFAAAGTYCLLAFKRLDYGSTTLIQLASMFVNRLLPGGIGALGVNYMYLKRSKHSASEAAAVLTLNNALGMIGHSLLLAGVLIISGKHLPATRGVSIHPRSIAFIAVGIAVITLTLLIFKRQTVTKSLSKFAHQLARFRERKLRLAGALLTSMSVTLLTIAGLWFCLMAVHVDVAFVTVFIVFSIGFSVGTAVPTPGGLGAVEAGLVAGFVAYNVPSAAALAGVLLYRLLTYWLALATGALAFGIAQHRELLKL
jgi:uncharacterized membrane protein YbhN (UPF0104 family)